QDSLKIDTSNMVLFGHSVGGWICLKAIQQLPTIKKGFALSAWNIGNDYKRVLILANDTNTRSKYFVVNASPKEIFSPVKQDSNYFNLINDGEALADKKIIMLDEHSRNKQLSETL